MIVHCEECGTRFKFDPERIKGTQARVKCGKCGFINLVRKPQGMDDAAQAYAEEKGPVSAKAGGSAESARQEREMKPIPAAQRKKGLRIGIEIKIVLFFFLPVVLGFVPMLLTISQMSSLSDMIMGECQAFINEFGKKAVIEEVRSQAYKLKTYFSSIPEFDVTQPHRDPRFKKEVQITIGKSGYTVLYSIPSPETMPENSTVWLHPDGGVVGTEFVRLMQESMGGGFASFWSLFKPALGGKEVNGFFVSKGKSGQTVETFLICVPVEGYPLGVAAFVPRDEIAPPLKGLKEKAREYTEFTAGLNLSIMAVTFIVIGSIVGLFGNRLAKRLKYLTSVADKISVGDLHTRIQVKSKDEIGDLAEAVGRMQESLRISIERLRRRGKK